MTASLTDNEKTQLEKTIEMFEVIIQSQPHDWQSLEILKESYAKLGRDRETIDASKRVAQAYVHLGQLSSAILEYESILQRFPDDLAAQSALSELASRAGGLAARTSLPEPEPTTRAASGPGVKTAASPAPPAEIDDGRAAMQKIFVDGKLISAAHFSELWPTPNLKTGPDHVIEPFVQVAHEKGLVSLDKSLKAICEKARAAYLPLDRYDVDVELARGFSKDVCRRWCILPFDRMSKTIFVATTNPFNLEAARELQNGPRRLIWYISPPAELAAALKKVFR